MPEDSSKLKAAVLRARGGDPAFGQRVAWFQAVDAKDIASIARLLLETPALVHERRRREEEPPPGVRWGVTALHLAAQRDDARVAELLIEAGADLESRATGTDAPGGGTPLHWAAKFGAFDVVKLLVEHGANVNPAEDSADQVSSGAQGSLLELLSHQAIAAYLIAHGAEVSIFSAVMLELEEEARKILDADRSKVQETRFLDFTPLHVAARKDLPQMIDLLLAYGAPRDIPDRLARTPIDIALLAGRTLAYDRLAAHGAQPSERARASAGTIERSQQLRRFLDACLEDLPAAEAMLALEPALANTRLPHFWENNYVGGTALHLAAALGRTELAQLLLRFGADRSLKDEKYGGTPSGWAKEYDRPDLAALLENASSVAQ
jgi:ankyrin repeat protein